MERDSLCVSRRREGPDGLTLGVAPVAARGARGAGRRHHGGTASGRPTRRPTSLRNAAPTTATCEAELLPAASPAHRQAGVPLRRWLWWALRCEAKWAFAWDDPMPFLRGVVGPRLSRLLRLPGRRRASDRPVPRAGG